MSLDKPKTLKDFIRFEVCRKLIKYIPDKSDEMFKKAYEFLAEPDTSIHLTGEEMLFQRLTDSGLCVELRLEMKMNTEKYKSITINGTKLYVEPVARNTRPGVGSGCSGCSGCGGGGCGGNNNNNNNA